MRTAVVFDFNRTLFDPDAEALFPEALKVLGGLRDAGVPLCLVCKGGPDRRDLIERLGLPQFFERIVVTERKGAENFQECKDLHPDCAWVVVGDRLEEELRHGAACGMRTIWLQKGKFADEVPADVPCHHVIYSLAELRNPGLGVWPE